MEATALEAIKTSFSAGLTDCVTNSIDLVMAAVPIALTLVGTMLAIKLGIKFFKNMSN